MRVNGYEKTGRFFVQYLIDTILDGSPPPGGLLITCVRDYHECFGSSKKQIKKYMNIIREHDQHVGPKMIIYYEDLVRVGGTRRRAVAVLAELLHDRGFDVGAFLYEWDKHWLASMAVYLSFGHESITGGQVIDHHKLKIKKGLRRVLDKQMEFSNKDLFEKYLKRYLTCC